MNEIIHKNLTENRWHTFSLAEQLGNIGSEVSRASRQEGKDQKLFDGAVERALELFSLTLSDKRWKNRMRELGRVKEVFCDAILGGEEYGSKLKDIQKYFDYFGILAMSKI